MGIVNYIKGDATNPKTDGNKIIVHVCNDIGVWGKGFVMAISKRWKTPELKYKEWFKTQDNFSLGQTQFVKVAADLWIANLIGQHRIYKDENGNPPIRYDSLAKGLDTVSIFAIEYKATVHLPRIGCGLAGGTWDKVEPLIQQSFVENGIETFVYDLN